MVAKSTYYKELWACFSVNLLETIDIPRLWSFGLFETCSCFYRVSPVCHDRPINENA